LGDELSELEMLEKVFRFFSAKGYKCQKHAVIKENGRFFEFDLVCRKDAETIVVEIKKTRALHQNHVQDIVSRTEIPLLRKAKIYLCILSSTNLLHGVQKSLEINGIGIIKVDKDLVQIALPAKEIDRRLIQLFTSALLNTLPLANISRSAVDSFSSTMSTLTTIPSLMNTFSQYMRTITPSRYRFRIARELLDKIDDLHRVGYANLLREFKDGYERVKNPKDENNTVLRTLEKLWAGKYGKRSGAKAFNSFEKFEPILKAIPGYRDHLIHSFQVFLMGAVIIDVHYDKFLQFYKKKLKNAQSDSVEFAWLLCSTFHDICYPVQMYESFNKNFFLDFLQSEVSPVLFQTEKLLLDDDHLKYIDQLVALYTHFQGRKEQSEKWEFDSMCKIDTNLRSMMVKEITNKNHALLSAIALLKKILAEEFVKRSFRLYKKGRFSTDVYPAALAIAMHDEKVLHKLRKTISLENIPLSFLLVYCDLVQECGRSEREEIAELHSFDCRSNIIQSTLVFEYKHDFMKKSREMEKVFKKIASNELCFRLDLRCKGSTRSEDSCKV
jgi:Holliday junction resolvase-like predicted endonuclease